MPVLIGWLDEFRHWPVIDVYIAVNSTEAERRRNRGIAVPGPIHLKAMIDTGAGRSVVTLSCLQSLALKPMGGDPVKVNSATTGNNPEEMDLYAVDVAMAGDRPGSISEDLEVIGSSKMNGLGVGMLLGRDILSGCLLVYDGPNRRFTLAYDRKNDTGI